MCLLRNDGIRTVLIISLIPHLNKSINDICVSYLQRTPAEAQEIEAVARLAVEEEAHQQWDARQRAPAGRCLPGCGAVRWGMRPRKMEHGGLVGGDMRPCKMGHGA